MGVIDETCACCTCCVCCLAAPVLWAVLSIVAITLAVLGTVALILYFLLVPKVPEVDLVGAQLQGFNLSSISGNANVSELQGGLIATLEIYNPNRVGLDYDASAVAFSYSTLDLSNATIDSFSGGGGGRENKTATLLFQTALPTSIQGPLSTAYQNGTVTTKLQVAVRGRIKIWGLASPRAEVNLECTLDISVFSQTVSNYACVRTKKYVA